jgi:hypothetical protein
MILKYDPLQLLRGYRDQIKENEELKDLNSRKVH